LRAEREIEVERSGRFGIYAEDVETAEGTEKRKAEKYATAEAELTELPYTERLD
jgi:hypothetical protein